MALWFLMASMVIRDSGEMLQIPEEKWFPKQKSIPNQCKNQEIIYKQTYKDSKNVLSMHVS